MVFPVLELSDAKQCLGEVLKRRLIYVRMICLEYLNVNWTTNFFTRLPHLDELSAILYVKEN